MTFPAGPLRRVFGSFGLDEGASLVPGRSDYFVQERLGDPIRVVLWVDDKQIDGSDKPAGSNRRSKRENRPPDHVAPDLGDEDARLGEIDQLSEQVCGVERALLIGRANDPAAQCDETLDVRDPGRSNLIFHAGEVPPRRVGDLDWQQSRTE